MLPHALAETASTSEVLDSIAFVPQRDGRQHLVHGLDGRLRGMRPRELSAFVRDLAAVIDTSRVDYVLGFPEGGTLPAFAFADLVDRPLVVSTRLRLQIDPAISFEEPHSRLGPTHWLFGLRAGDRVVIIEDEVTTGRTVVNAVRALRDAGVLVRDVGTLIAVDTPEMWRRMADADVTLHARLNVPPPSRSPAAEP